jgi:hypothetical protein
MTLAISVKVCEKCMAEWSHELHRREPTYDDAVHSWTTPLTAPGKRTLWFCPDGGTGEEGKPPPIKCRHKFEHAVAAAEIVNVDSKK